MYFDELTLNAFGPLDGTVSLESERVNLIEAPNESGKSTFARAVVVLLYGFVSASRKESETDGEDRLTDWKRFQPWTRDGYGVSAEIAGRSEALRVIRNLDEEQLKVLKASSGADVTNQYQEDGRNQRLGEHLTGLSRSAFEKSVLVNQNDVELGSARGDLVQAIQKIADTNEGDVTAQRAMEILEEARQSFPGRFVADRGSLETEIERVEDRIDEIDGELQALRRRRRRAESKIEQADELEQKIDDVEEKLDRIELFETIARKREYENKLNTHQRRKEKLEELKRELDELKTFEGFPHGQQEHLLRSHEQYSQLDEQIEEYRDEEEDVQDELERVRDVLRDMGPYGQLESEEVDELLEFSEQARHYRDELNGSMEQLEQERQELDGHEDLLDEFHRLRYRFQDLDAEDRDFLSDVKSRLRELSDQASESERRVSEARQNIESIDRERSWIKIRYAVLSVICGVFIAIGGVFLVWVASFPGTIGTLLTLTGIVGGGYSIFRWLRAGRHRSDERSECQVMLDREAERQMELSQDRSVLRKQATILAGKLGLESVNDLLEKFDRYRQLYDELSSLIEVDAQVQRQKKKLENMIRSHDDLLDRCRLNLTTSSPVQEYEELKEELEQFRTYRKRVADLETRQASIWADRSALERKRDVEERNMRSILDRAGIDTEDQSLDDAVETFETKYEKYIRLQSIKQKIPEIKEGMLSAEKRRELQRMKEQLEDHLEGVRDEWPDVEVPEELGNPEQYRQRRTTLDQQKRTLIADRADLEREVGSLETEFRNQYADLQDEKEELTVYRNRLVRLNRSVEEARKAMKQVSQDVHAEWARTLNQQASRIIEQLAPAYSNVQFRADLSFSIETSERDELLSPDEIQDMLSAGARSQIFLAIRLSLATYFTNREDGLPIILDEPFAHWDDERFRRAWELLTEEFLPNHQIIYLTSHASRIKWLRDQNTDWFDEYFVSTEL